MKIGVTGAFGFLGANFVAALLSERRDGLFPGEAIEVTAFASKVASNPLFDPAKVEVKSLDVLSRGDMAVKFAGLDALAHFAGRVDYRKSQRRAVWDTNTLGAKAVFDAVLEAGVPRLLYVSSISALGSGSAGHPADEGSLPYGDPRWPISFASPEAALAAVEASSAGDYRFLDGMRVAYFDSKLAGWELAKAYARGRSLPVVTVFPGTAVGAGDLHFAISRLVDNVWEGRLPFSFGGATTFMAARDLAEGAALALSRGRVGEGYVIAGREEHSLSYVDFQRLVAGLARRADSRPAVLPIGLLLGIAGAAEAVAPRGGLAKALVLAGSARNVATSAKARSELGYEPSPSLEGAILECRKFSEGLRLRRKSIG